jgi:hypothetical protein
MEVAAATAEGAAGRYATSSSSSSPFLTAEALLCFLRVLPGVELLVQLAVVVRNWQFEQAGFVLG